MILMCMTTELSCNSVLVTVDDLIVVPTPVFIAEVDSGRNVSYDVNLQKIFTKLITFIGGDSLLLQCAVYCSILDEVQ